MKVRSLAIPLLLVGPGAFAHTYVVCSGVHFKGVAVDFGAPPRRYALTYTNWDVDASGWRPGTDYYLSRYQWDGGHRDWQLFRQGRNQEVRGDNAAALTTYRKMRRAGLGDANFLAKRVALLKELGSTRPRGLDQYLAATLPTQWRKPGLPKLESVDPKLRPWIAYEQAWMPKQFLAFSRNYPDSALAPAALITACRQLLVAPNPPRESMWAAREAALLLRQRYPTSRFVWDAEGTLGRIDYLQGRTDMAVARYEHQFKTATHYAQIVLATDSIAWCRRRQGDLAGMAIAALDQFGADQAKGETARASIARLLRTFTGHDSRAFWHRLSRNPERLASYLDYRVQFTKPTAELLRLGEGAVRLQPFGSNNGHLAAALGNIAYELRDSRRARRWATRGLTADRNDDRALSHFVLGGLDRRSGNNRRATEHFRAILHECPHSYLAPGARENLALLAEKRGDLSEALAHYLALGYTEDVAYMADARMSPRQLASFIDSNPKAAKRDVLIYTLAMRYLRISQWDAAERTLRRLSDARRRQLTGVYGNGYGSYDDDPKKHQDPWSTMSALRRLDATVTRAKGEARAQALLAQGDYYYFHPDLLLYSPYLWQGRRAVAFANSWNPSVASPADDLALARHHNEHECLSQALRRYREILRRHPHSRVAPEAAYRAACAARRLSNMSAYWRWREAKDDLQGEAIRDMRLAAKSPNSALAKKARKFAKVFREDRYWIRQAFAGEHAPPRRYAPW